MPLVHAYYVPEKIGEETFTKLHEVLSVAVSAVLSGSEANSSLEPDDIEIAGFCLQHGEDNFHGVDLAIVIWAHDFPSRRENVDYRAQGILDQLRESLPLGHIRVFVWIILAPTGFAKI